MQPPQSSNSLVLFGCWLFCCGALTASIFWFTVGVYKSPTRSSILLEHRFLPKPSANAAKYTSVVVSPVSSQHIQDSTSSFQHDLLVTTTWLSALRPGRPGTSRDITHVQDSTSSHHHGVVTTSLQPAPRDDRAATPPHTTALSTPSVASSQPFLDIRSPRCGQCFRKSFSPVHASALVIESYFDLPALSKYQYFVHYINSDDRLSGLHWAHGRTSLLWPAHKMDAIPYADLALDVVVVNNSAFLSGAARLASCLSEAVRVLVPDGVLLLLEPLSALPKFQLAALVTPTKFRNAFLRVEKAPGLPACESGRIRGDGSWRCQPTVPNGYVSLRNPARTRDILKHTTLAHGRFRTSLIDNVWTKGNSEYAQVATRDRYTSHKGEKVEWRSMPVLAELVRTKKVRRMLDAGAGSCAMYGVLVQSGLMDIVPQPVYMAYGGYNPHFYQFCGERGTISFDHSWLNPHPFCSTCKFDLVFQFEGVHHTEALKNETLLMNTFNNFDAVLKCGGWLMLQDSNCFMAYQRSGGKGGCQDPSQTWENTFRKWVQRKPYKPEAGNQKEARLFYRKVC